MIGFDAVIVSEHQADLRRVNHWSTIVLVIGLVSVPACANVAGFEDFSGATAPVHACASLPTTKEDPSGLGLMVRVDKPALVCSWIDQKEVTVERYERFLAAPADQVTWDPNFCTWKGERSDPRSNPNDRCAAQIPPTDRPPFAPSKPIRCVDFCDAQAFCSWEGKHLCDEEDDYGINIPPANGRDWFMACTNATTTIYPWGNEGDARHCNAGQTPDTCTRPTRSCGVQRGGEYSQCVTQSGVYDLLGNVDEWVYSCTNITLGVPGSPRGCFAKGGGYDAEVESCRLTHTFSNDTRLPSLGFRCCADLTSVEEMQRQKSAAKD